jgi:translation initiation factor 2 beta subunit (eIF-2beta)/eIF-5
MMASNSFPTVPIPASVTDPFYRYKRDSLHISIERKKGTQTRLENIDRIANQLNVPIKHLIKTLSKAIGSRISGGVIAGKIEAYVLEKVLEDFIVREVLCTKCKLPELDATHNCKACGHTATRIRKKNRTENENKIPSSSAIQSEIDNLACKLIRRIDDLLADKTSHKIAHLETLKEICWNAESLDELSKVEKELV